MNKTCSTCKWWDDSACLLMMSEDGKPNHAESKAIAYDGELYFAYVKTDADFGCNQHELKETK